MHLGVLPCVRYSSVDMYAPDEKFVGMHGRDAGRSQRCHFVAVSNQLLDVGYGKGETMKFNDLIQPDEQVANGSPQTPVSP